MPDRIQSFKVLCEGGLNSNQHHLELSERTPGAATSLINFEPSLSGGYRRMEGFSLYDEDYPEVGAGSSEGKILGVAVYRNEDLGNPVPIAARKDTVTDTYSFWRYVPLVGWQVMDKTGLTLSTTDGTNGVFKVRSVQFNFGDGDRIVFVDGVNQPVIFDGTNWHQLTVAGVGTPADPGGNQLVLAPSVVDVFENHLFFSGSPTSRAIVCHSAPNDPFDFTAAGGGGQIITGFSVVQIKPFRKNLFVFGNDRISSVNVDAGSGNFVIQPVTVNVGCVARDSVQEIGGDLIFLAPDGIRPVAGTSRIGDVELETVSRQIQGLINILVHEKDLDALNSVVVRGKSQFRYFFDDDLTPPAFSEGIVGGLLSRSGRLSWEYGSIRGIRASCCTSEYIKGQEYILHGDYDGRVYRQESGNTFGGEPIIGIYTTPYYDFGDTEVRKTFHRLNLFLRAEGPVDVNFGITYDWGDAAAPTPPDYSAAVAGELSFWGDALLEWGVPGKFWGGSLSPVIFENIQGSGRSLQATFVTLESSEPFSIQGMVWEFATSGRR